MEGDVWYVAYGSNLSANRLQEYLDSCPPVTGPLAWEPVEVPHQLYFTGRSSRWGGAPAFLDPQVDPAAGTLGVAWLLHEHQFAGVLARENGRTDLTLPRSLPTFEPGGSTRLFDSRYGLVVGCESPDPRPAFTFTSASVPVDRARPSPAYVDVMVAGLVAAHGLSATAARAYVESRIG